jgi:hypothetical protein
MGHSRHRAAIGIVALVLAACSTDAGPRGTDTSGADGRGARAVEESPSAAAAVQQFSLRFVRSPSRAGAALVDPGSVGAGLRPGAPPGVAAPSEPSPVLRASDVERFEESEGRLVPHFSTVALQAVTKRATLALPRVASAPFTLRDEETNMSLAVNLAGASDTLAEVSRHEKGHVVYRGAYGRGDVVHRPTAEGTEDFVVFEEAPETPVVRYVSALGEGVAGLRLVSNTLEFLDGHGVPRLRVAPPYLIGADGREHDARLAVEGCAVDANPAAPDHRPVTAPGAAACTVVVSWNGAEVAYPAVLDPSWTTTGSMATARYYHVTNVLSSGKVLAAGGLGSAPLASAELYDPATGTWAATGSLATARQLSSSNVLGNGKVLVAAGYNNGPLASAELYDPATGTWAATGSLATARYFQ